MEAGAQARAQASAVSPWPAPSSSSSASCPAGSGSATSALDRYSLARKMKGSSSGLPAKRPRRRGARLKGGPRTTKCQAEEEGHQAQRRGLQGDDDQEAGRDQGHQDQASSEVTNRRDQEGHHEARRRRRPPRRRRSPPRPPPSAAEPQKPAVRLPRHRRAPRSAHRGQRPGKLYRGALGPQYRGARPLEERTPRRGAAQRADRAALPARAIHRRAPAADAAQVDRAGRPDQRRAVRPDGRHPRLRPGPRDQVQDLLHHPHPRLDPRPAALPGLGAAPRAPEGQSHRALATRS